MRRLIACTSAIIFVLAIVYITQKPVFKTKVLFVSNVEILARGESIDLDCLVGGEGATQCSIQGGVTIIGHGVTVGAL